MIDEAFNAGLSVARVKKIKVAINRVFIWGIEEGLITDVKTSPVHGMELPKPESKMKPILTQDEVKLLMLEAYKREHPWRHIWAVALLTGMRSGELHALMWSDIDLDNKIIRITKSWNPKLRGIKSTKNSDWDGGYAGTILRNFLKSIGIEKYVNFHTFRACFATHVLASEAEPKGITDNFKVMCRRCLMKRMLGGGL